MLLHQSSFILHHELKATFMSCRSSQMGRSLTQQTPPRALLPAGRPALPQTPPITRSCMMLWANCTPIRAAPIRSTSCHSWAPHRGDPPPRTTMSCAVKICRKQCYDFALPPSVQISNTLTSNCVGLQRRVGAHVGPVDGRDARERQPT